MCRAPHAFQSVAWNSLFYLSLATPRKAPLYPSVAGTFLHSTAAGVCSSPLAPQVLSPPRWKQFPFVGKLWGWLSHMAMALPWMSFSFLSTCLWAVSYFIITPSLSPLHWIPGPERWPGFTTRMPVGWAWSTDTLYMGSSAWQCLANISISEKFHLRIWFSSFFWGSRTPDNSGSIFLHGIIWQGPSGSSRMGMGGPTALSAPHWNHPRSLPMTAWLPFSRAEEYLPVPISRLRQKKARRPPGGFQPIALCSTRIAAYAFEFGLCAQVWNRRAHRLCNLSILSASSCINCEASTSGILSQKNRNNPHWFFFED